MGARNYDDGVAQPFFEQPILNSPMNTRRGTGNWTRTGNPPTISSTVGVPYRSSRRFPPPASSARLSASWVWMMPRGRADEDGQQYELMRMIESVRHSVNEWPPATPSPVAGYAGDRSPAASLAPSPVQRHPSILLPGRGGGDRDLADRGSASAGRDGRQFVQRLQEANDQANPGLPRLALKLATGAGKTTVMAMLIAWQTVNAVRHPGSRRFTRGFLVVTPGLTIRDRLRVLQPNDPGQLLPEPELVPRACSAICTAPTSYYQLPRLHADARHRTSHAVDAPCCRGAALSCTRWRPRARCCSGLCPA